MLRSSRDEACSICSWHERRAHVYEKFLGLQTPERAPQARRAHLVRAMAACVVLANDQCQVSPFRGDAHALAYGIDERHAGLLVAVVRRKQLGGRQAFAEIVHEDGPMNGRIRRKRARFAQVDLKTWRQSEAEGGRLERHAQKGTHRVATGPAAIRGSTSRERNAEDSHPTPRRRRALFSKQARSLIDLRSNSSGEPWSRTTHTRRARHRFSRPCRAPARLTLRLRKRKDSSRRPTEAEGRSAPHAAFTARIAFQASFVPDEFRFQWVWAAGLEPAPSRFRTERSSQLSYTQMMSARRELNPERALIRRPGLTETTRG